MIEKIIMNKNNIPDGMLHDQKLCEISLKNKVLILGYDVALSKNEYAENDFAKKYLQYKKCYIKCRIEDETSCEIRLEVTQNKYGKGKFQYLSLKDFVNTVSEKICKNKTHKDFFIMQYLCTYISPDINNTLIDFYICNLKYRGTKYSMCTLLLETEEIEFIWE